MGNNLLGFMTSNSPTELTIEQFIFHLNFLSHDISDRNKQVLSGEWGQNNRLALLCASTSARF